ncbi:MAG: PA0069 family radical SAM protein [Phycisphaerales bacterium]|nr:PA0069 family radical SAM protein [Phycisphaerales bacterium]
MMSAVFMLRRVANPPNPFTAEHCEWLDEPPAISLDVYEETAKSILSENDSPDIPFRWSLNPYRGCQHACAYCYARPYHEYLDLGAGTDFDSKITVKVNAPELLAAELRRPRRQREQIVFSGVTDCYQPLEAVYRLTRRCLEVCLSAGNPVGIITKSYLVARDASLLAQLNAAAGARVHMSICFADDARARAIEPGAPPPSRRFDAMRRLRDAGVGVGIMLAPLIPGLNDGDIPALLERAAECGASSAAYTALRLPGSVREVFLTRLREALPDRAARVEARIRDMRGGQLTDPRFVSRMDGQGPYWESVRQLFEKTASRLGLAEPPPCGAVGEPGGRTNSNPVETDREQPAGSPRDRSSHPTQLPLFE